MSGPEAGAGLREAIETAARGDEVSPALLEAAFARIVAGEATPAQIAALLVALRTKGESVAEIAAVARALRAAADSRACPVANAIDTCGTGGDGADTFNISTTAAFVVAGAGVPVAKHGNRAASSRSGSADVLEALGVAVELSVERSAAILAEVGIAFFFARVAHPAMRHVAPVRQELGIRTLMNALGPLLNPVGVRRQVVGVYARDLVLPLASALGELGAERALVAHGSDGLDELTTTGASHAAFLDAGVVRELEITPESVGLARAESAALAGGDASANAAITRSVLDGEPGAPRDIVVLNAAAGLWVGGASADLVGGAALAQESIDSGRARAKLAGLAKATRA